MKNKIFYFILGIIITSMVVVGADYIYRANQVSYTPNNSNFDVDNVESAINDLYQKASDNSWFIFYATNKNGGYYLDSDGKSYGNSDDKIPVQDLATWINSNSNFLKNFTWNYTSGTIDFDIVPAIMITKNETYGISLVKLNANTHYQIRDLNFMAYGAGLMGIASK